MKMYSKGEYTVFGYKKTNKKFKYNFNELMYYGRYCTTGIAAKDEAKNEMTCAKIDTVKSNIDKFKTTQSIPTKCIYSDGSPKAC